MRHVAVDGVIQRRHIGRSLDRRVAAQRHDAGAGAAVVSKQQLQQRAAPDGLHAAGVLRPRHGVGKRRRPVGARVVEDRVRHAEERVPGTSRRALDQVWRVAAEMPLHDLEDAPRVLQGVIARRRWRQQRSDERLVGRTWRTRRLLLRA
jgi:hypothetical protein